MHIEDAKSGDVLWSGNLASTQFYEVEDSWYETVMDNKMVLLNVAGGLLALLALIWIFKSFLGAMTRVR